MKGGVVAVGCIRIGARELQEVAVIPVVTQLVILVVILVVIERVMRVVMISVEAVMQVVIPVVIPVVMQGGRAATFGGLVLLAVLPVDIPVALPAALPVVRGAVAAVAQVIGVAVHRLSAMGIAVAPMQLWKRECSIELMKK
jgi:hypothetical protein